MNFLVDPESKADIFVKSKEICRNRRYLYLSAFSSNLLAFMVGVSVTWTSPVLPKLQSANIADNPLERPIDTSEASWIGALYGVGGICGPFLAGYVLSHFGRRRCILLCSGIPFAVAYYLIAFSNAVYLYYLSRFVIGMAASSTYLVVPMYNAEISEVSIRGRICAMISVFVTFGELFSYAVGSYLSITFFSLTLAIIATIATILGFFVLPESPHYLIGREDHLEARKSLMKLRSATAEEVKEEFELAVSIVKEAKNQKVTSLREVFKSKAIRKAQLMVLGLAFFQITSGNIPIIFYAQTIFKQSGSQIPPHLCAIAIGFTKFLTSFITSTIVDKCGRKPLLAVSAIGMMIFEFLLGTFFFLKYTGYSMDAFSWLPIVCLEAYIFSYVMGFGPLLWTMMGEIFPSEVKSTASTITCCFFWIMLFLVSKALHLLCDPLGIVICFWIFSGCCALALFFVLGVVIETKGKNFQEIRLLLEK